MAKFWKYFVPTIAGLAEDTEEHLKRMAEIERRTATALLEGIRTQRDRAQEECNALRDILRGNEARFEALYTQIQDRDLLLQNLLNKVKDYKGPISKQFKEEYERAIYEVWGNPQSTEPSDGTDPSNT